MMKSLSYLQRQEGGVQFLIDMLDYVAGRLALGKDVLPHILKEIIELLQTDFNASLRPRMDTIVTFTCDRGSCIPDPESNGVNTPIGKYERFLLRVIETCDLGHEGAKWVFAHYAVGFIFNLRQRLHDEREILALWIGSREHRDGEIPKQLKKTDTRLKGSKLRPIERVEILRQELQTMAA